MRSVLCILVVVVMGIAGSGCETDTGCQSDYDCAGTKVCRVATGTCVPFVCRHDSDCEDGESCQDNTCVK